MTRFSRRDALAMLTTMGAVIASPSVLRAQTYPTKPIRLIVGFAPGGLSDLLSRLIAPVLTEQLGQQVLVENRPGANGNVANAAVATAAPDGHTLLFSSGSQIIYTPNTYKSASADPVNDLKHISMMASGDFIFFTNDQTGLKTLDDLLKFAKANPDKLNYGTPGAGGSQHVLFEFFKKLADIKLTPVHYRGSGPMIPDALANQVQLGSDGLALIEPHIKAGKLVPLFVASTKREPALPNVPNAVEVNLPDLAKLNNWFGMQAPKATPDAIVDKINAAMKVALKNETILDRLKVAGMTPVGDSPQEFTQKIVAASKMIGEIARSANIQIE